MLVQSTTLKAWTLKPCIHRTGSGSAAFPLSQQRASFLAQGATLQVQGLLSLCPWTLVAVLRPQRTGPSLQFTRTLKLDQIRQFHFICIKK